MIEMKAFTPVCLTRLPVSSVVRILHWLAKHTCTVISFTLFMTLKGKNVSMSLLHTDVD